MGRPVGLLAETGPGTGADWRPKVGVKVGPSGASVLTVGALVGAGEGLRVIRSPVTDATTRLEIPSALLAAAWKAVAVRDDSMSLENVSDDEKLVSESDTATVKETLQV